MVIDLPQHFEGLEEHSSKYSNNMVDEEIGKYAIVGISRAIGSGRGKIWLYCRHDDFFYKVECKHEESILRIVDDKKKLLGLFRLLLSMIGEEDAKIEWIISYREREDRFIGLYCCYVSGHTYGKSYIVLLIFSESRDFKRNRLDIARRLELMRRLWVYLP